MKQAIWDIEEKQHGLYAGNAAAVSTTASKLQWQWRRQDVVEEKISRD